MGRVLVFGEILFDMYDDGKRIGGAPFNLACHLHRFGVEVLFVSRVGTDGNGDEALRFCRDNGLDTTLIDRDPDHPTGRVTVHLDDRAVPDFTIEKNAAYDFIRFGEHLADALRVPIDVVCFGTLAQRNEESRSTLSRVLDCRGKNTLRFCDINLRESCYTPETVRGSLVNADILKLNDDELDKVCAIENIRGDEHAKIEKLADAFGLEAVCVTKGSDGAVLYSRGEYSRYVSSSDARPIVDTVGAGDGFSAVLTLGIVRGWPPEKTMEKAGFFAHSICTVRGALPDSLDVQYLL